MKKFAVALLIFALLVLAVPASASRLSEWATQTTLKWSFLGTLWYGHFADALQDAYTWGQGDTQFLVNSSNWHFWKATSNLSYGVSGIVLAYSFGSKKISLKTSILRTIGGALIGNVIWDYTYMTARYGNPFDYSPAHNRHAIVYWDIHGRDHYIGLNEFTRPLWDITRIAVGMYLIGRE